MILRPPGPPTPPPKPCKCTKIHVFSMNQEPPAPPHHIAHTMKCMKILMIFNDSWAARAAHPTAETMQMHRNLIYPSNQEPPAPHHPIAHTMMKINGNAYIFNDSEAARAAQLTAETMHMFGSRRIFNNSGKRPGRARWLCASWCCVPSTAFTRLSVFFCIHFGCHSALLGGCAGGCAGQLFDMQLFR